MGGCWAERGQPNLITLLQYYGFPYTTSQLYDERNIESGTNVSD